jgi:hypothetical protein
MSGVWIQKVFFIAALFLIFFSLLVAAITSATPLRFFYIVRYLTEIHIEATFYEMLIDILAFIPYFHCSIFFNSETLNTALAVPRLDLTIDNKRVKTVPLVSIIIGDYFCERLMYLNLKRGDDFINGSHTRLCDAVRVDLLVKSEFASKWGWQTARRRGTGATEQSRRGTGCSDISNIQSRHPSILELDQQYRVSGSSGGPRSIIKFDSPMRASIKSRPKSVTFANEEDEDEYDYGNKDSSRESQMTNKRSMIDQFEFDYNSIFPSLTQPNAPSSEMSSARRINKIASVTTASDRPSEMFEMSNIFRGGGSGDEVSLGGGEEFSFTSDDHNAEVKRRAHISWDKMKREQRFIANIKFWQTFAKTLDTSAAVEAAEETVEEVEVDNSNTGNADVNHVDRDEDDEDDDYKEMERKETHEGKENQGEKK